VELYQFDEAYVRRLKEGDSSVQRHFFAYFSELVLIKLRSRYLPPHVIDDIRQETFVRVLVTLKKEDGLKSPERLGAFVNSVCNNVLQEHYRVSTRATNLDDVPEPQDLNIDLDRTLVSGEAKRQVAEILDQLSERDQRVLRALFLEDKTKDQICREMSIDRDYLRVLLHRAKLQFRQKFMESRFAGSAPM
jgi:RNA polymerase sigma-70 factor (ECF subfamily)